MLEVCRRLEIDPVLVTCDVDNVASRRTIEGAGGEYDDTREGKRRYWIRLD
jgi:predicted acetyltransferase